MLPIWTRCAVVLSLPVLSLARDQGLERADAFLATEKNTMHSITADVAAATSDAVAVVSDGSFSWHSLLTGWPGWGWAASIAASSVREHGREHGMPGSAESSAMPLSVRSVLGIVCLVLILAIATCSWHWQHESAQSKKDQARLNMDEWLALADKRELDFYTCMALSVGRHKGATLHKFLPKMMALVALQPFLGCIIMYSQFNGGIDDIYPHVDGVAFRVAGVVLFVYSVRNLIDNMEDRCRYLLFHYLQKKNCSSYYTWPLLFGEFMNLFVGLLLMVILFCVFCHTKNAANLLLDCIAVNFVSDIDNEFVTEDESIEAIDNLKAAVVEWNSDDMMDNGEMKLTTTARLSRKSQAAVGICAEIIGHVVPLVAICLTVLFATVHNRWACDHMREVSPWFEWPFCVGFE